MQPQKPWFKASLKLGLDWVFSNNVYLTGKVNLRSVRAFTSFVTFFRLLAQRQVAEIRQHILNRKRNTAAVAIQSYWRMFRARKQFLAELKLKRETRAAILIQTRWRIHFAQKRYNCLLAELERRRQKSAVAIQKNWRAFVQLQKFLSVRRRVVVVQSVVRTHLARKRFLELRRSATIVSANYKRLVERRKYLKVRKNIITAQSAVRR